MSSLLLTLAPGKRVLQPLRFQQKELLLGNCMKKKKTNDIPTLRHWRAVEQHPGFFFPRLLVYTVNSRGHVVPLDNAQFHVLAQCSTFQSKNWWCTKGKVKVNRFFLSGTLLGRPIDRPFVNRQEIWILRAEAVDRWLMRYRGSALQTLFHLSHVWPHRSFISKVNRWEPSKGNWMMIQFLAVTFLTQPINS